MLDSFSSDRIRTVFVFRPGDFATIALGIIGFGPFAFGGSVWLRHVDRN